MFDGSLFNPFDTPDQRIDEVRRDLTETSDEVSSLRWRLSDAESRIDQLEEAVRVLTDRLGGVGPDGPKR